MNKERAQRRTYERLEGECSSERSSSANEGVGADDADSFGGGRGRGGTRLSSTRSGLSEDLDGRRTQVLLAVAKRRLRPRAGRESGERDAHDELVLRAPLARDARRREGEVATAAFAHTLAQLRERAHQLLQAHSCLEFTFRTSKVSCTVLRICSGLTAQKVTAACPTGSGDVNRRNATSDVAVIDWPFVIANTFTSIE